MTCATCRFLHVAGDDEPRGYARCEADRCGVILRYPPDDGLDVAAYTGHDGAIWAHLARIDWAHNCDLFETDTTEIPKPSTRTKTPTPEPSSPTPTEPEPFEVPATQTPEPEPPTTTETPDPWNTTQDDPGYRADAERRIQRARREAVRVRADGQPMFACPFCGRSYVPVTIDGRPRRSCPDERCRGKAWAASARTWLDQQRRHTPRDVAARRHDLPLATVEAIRTSYVPGQLGCRALARRYDVHPETVRRIVRGMTYKEGTR